MTNIRKDHLINAEDDIFLGHGEVKPKFGHTIMVAVNCEEPFEKFASLSESLYSIPRLDSIPPWV